MTWEAEAGRLQVQGQPELHRKFKFGLGNLVRTCLNIKRGLGYLRGWVRPMITRPLLKVIQFQTTRVSRNWVCHLLLTWFYNSSPGGWTTVGSLLHTSLCVVGPRCTLAKVVSALGRDPVGIGACTFMLLSDYSCPIKASMRRCLKSHGALFNSYQHP